MGLEREIKLRFASAEDAGRRVRALGAVPLRERRLQRDCLLDTETGTLQATRSTLRVRDEGGRGFVTFKGAPQPGQMKMREELETAVSDAGVLVGILARAGFSVRFRYEKYRQEFSAEGVIIAIDETPIGVIVEIEGEESRIHDVARALGCGPADYVTRSYRDLFLEEGRARGLSGTDMIFARLGE